MRALVLGSLRTLSEYLYLLIVGESWFCGLVVLVSCLVVVVKRGAESAMLYIIAFVPLV